MFPFYDSFDFGIANRLNRTQKRLADNAIVQEQKDTISALRKECADLTARAEEVSSKLERREKRYAEMFETSQYQHRMQNELVTVVKTLKKEIAEIKYPTDDYPSKSSNSASILSSATANLTAAFDRQLERDKGEWAQEKSKLEQTISGLEQAKALLETKVAALAETVDGLQNEKTSWSTRLAALSSTNSDLSQAVAAEQRARQDAQAQAELFAVEGNKCMAVLGKFWEVIPGCYGEGITTSEDQIREAIKMEHCHKDVVKRFLGCGPDEISDAVVSEYLTDGQVVQVLHRSSGQIHSLAGYTAEQHSCDHSKCLSASTVDELYVTREYVQQNYHPQFSSLTVEHVEQNYHLKSESLTYEEVEKGYYLRPDVDRRISQHSKEIGDLSSQLGEVKADLSKTQVERDAALSEKAALTDTLDDLRKRFDPSNAAANSADAVPVLRLAVKQLEEQLKACKAQSVTDLNHYKDKAEEAEEKNQRLNDQVEELQEQLKAAQPKPPPPGGRKMLTPKGARKP